MQCWGHLAANHDYTVYLPLAYSTTNYTIMVTQENTIANCVPFEKDRTTTTVYIAQNWNGAIYKHPVAWMSIGY